MANICPCTFANGVSRALNNLRSAKKLGEKPETQTSRAIVLSRRVDTCYRLEQSDSSWAYLVTFRLENGEEIELRTDEDIYKFCTEGKSGSLTWQGTQLVAFA